MSDIPNKDKFKQKGKMVKGPTDIYKIVRMIMERNYQPVIVFAFSKRECENLGLQMSKLDFNDGKDTASLLNSSFHWLSPFFIVVTRARKGNG